MRDLPGSVLDLEWFAVRVRTSYEKLVFDQLQQKDFELFLPTYKKRSVWSDRVKHLDCPLFPGYLFCKLNIVERLSVLRTPGVINLVGNRRTPVPLADDEIAQLKSIVNSDLKIEPWPLIQVGQKIRIDKGPLKGVEGVLSEIKTGYRLVVSVNLLQRAVAAEMDASWISPVSLHPVVSEAPTNERSLL